MGCGGGVERSRDLTTWSGPGRDSGRLVTPRAIAVAGSRVWVVDRSGRVQAFDRAGRPEVTLDLNDGVRGFPVGILGEEDGGFLLVDTHRHRLRRFDAAGKETGTIGGFGTEPGSFTYPQRAARDANGRLYVTEYGQGSANRVQVFDAAFDVVCTFGEYGRGPGQFTRAMGIGVRDDEVFVADAADRILVFDTRGVFRREFGSTGSEVGALRYPYGLAIVAGAVVVAEYGNHRLQRFDSEGRGLGCYGGPGSGALLGPWDVATDRAGTLFVCDTGHHRIVMGEFDEIPWSDA
jgi:DNA-binding beta-propeller fold protein YncE